MHPAYSVILFTTASGAGYGLLVWLALAALLSRGLPLERWFGLVGFGIAFGLVTAGLLSSTAHLGRPERAWRAFSQWRTSWLSREGVMAVLTYIPAGFLALGWVLFQQGLATSAILTALCAVGTLYTTGMIYASLRTIRHWHQPLTAPIYIVLGLASGAVLFNALLHMVGFMSEVVAWLAVALLAAGALLKVSYWRAVDTSEKRYTVEMATGLGYLGKVRPLEPPHTQPNFVMREMGYTIARKHAEKLRTLVLVLGFAAPIAATLLTLIPEPMAGLAGSMLAIPALTVGLFVERWLFFAEAEHVSMLYYGADAA